MRYFVYNGDRLETSLFGLSFRAGRPTAVDPETVSAKYIAKLAGNPEFAEVLDAAGPGPVVTAPVSELQPAVVVEPDPEQSESDEMEALRQEADSIGLQADKRWGLARLRREVEAARG